MKKISLVLLMIITLIIHPLIGSLGDRTFAHDLEYEVNNQIEISTVEDLKDIDQDLNGHYLIVNNIDLENTEWIPLGDSEHPFNGVLETENSEVKIFGMKSKYESEEAQGLFEAVTDEAVVDVKIEFAEDEKEEAEKEEAEKETEIEVEAEKDNNEKSSEEKITKDDIKTSEEKLYKAMERLVLYSNENESEMHLPPAEIQEQLVPFYDEFSEATINRKGGLKEFREKTVIQLTDIGYKAGPGKDGQLTVVWSKDKLDLNEDFSLRSFVYLGAFGPDAHDGMTITFQNDPRMENNRNEVYADDGSQLGVYDGRTNKNGKYIDNAISIEFDTYRHTGHSWRNMDHGVDVNDKFGHVAMVIPGPDNMRTVNDHEQLNYPSTPLSNGVWKEFNVEWDSQTNLLSFELDHLNRDGNKISGSKVIDVQEVFGGTEVYWGVTAVVVDAGDNGPQHNMFGFASLPQKIILDQESTIQNVSNQGNKQKEITATAGDEVEIEVDTTFIEGGNKSWRGGRVIAKLPSELELDKDSILDNDTIMNASDIQINDDEISFKPIDPMLSKNNNLNNLKFKAKIKDNVDEDELKITIRGEGDNYSVECNPLLIKMVNNGLVKVHYLDENGLEIDETTILEGLIGSDYATEPKDIEYYVLDAEALPTNATGKFTKDTIDVTYRYVKGELKFIEAPKKLNFLPEISSSTKNWFVDENQLEGSLIIEDNRAVKATWELHATLEKELTGSAPGRILEDVLYYKQGDNETFLNAEAKTVYKENYSTTLPDGLVETNITEDWKKDTTGLHLRLKPGNIYKDEYKGEVKWTLVDAP